ncbi:hypothetical protein NZD88_03155 [Chryseobacterium antibioticum]|uniref:CTP synthase (glutamine hydrolyzing) n=1 Tax=Chryseobacterium pyrolae TaxID=2987481 RepID=A0ABT2ID66_9FLAO|nr:hypothetical protein [Chryseobacterium pyrolae]MCT2406551.1 hypothetical protein [Chryseobacterium pyrolae]
MIEKIAILGDFNPIHYTLHQLNNTTRDVQKVLKKEIQFDWISTDIFDARIVFEKQDYKGLWVAPGSPYKDMNGVLNTICYARENNIPTFGNCGGFQHMVIEFAQNVCGIQDAGNEETDPTSPDLLIKKLACSLKGEEEILNITEKNSFLYQILKEDTLLGKYHCSYGINELYINKLRDHGMVFTSISEDGNHRSFEITDHPFFVGTLFQPALTSTLEAPNPLIIEFVKKSLKI